MSFYSETTEVAPFPVPVGSPPPPPLSPGPLRPISRGAPSRAPVTIDLVLSTVIMRLATEVLRSGRLVGGS
eukprot:gene26996-9014_t